MVSTTVRELSGDEMLEVMFQMSAYSFYPSPPLIDKAVWQEMVRQRRGVTSVGLFEDDMPAAAAGVTAMTQQVRGSLFEMGGVWGVATAPAARRSGYARRVLAQLLATARENGAVFSCLYPFRESFYERLGYVTFPLPRKARFSPVSLVPLLKNDLGGKVKMMPINEGYDAYLTFLSDLRLQTHGMALFKYADMGWAQQNRFWLALACEDDRVVGLMVYDLKGENIADFLLRAVRFYYLTSQGKYLLLQWIARHADQASQAEVWLAPFEQPETWLSDIQVKIETVARAPMGRVLDVSRLSGLCAGPGRLSVRISDPLCGWNEGDWQLEGVEGKLQVRQAEGADCLLSIQALTALVYGTHAPSDLVVRGWGNPSPKIQTVLSEMFPAQLPYLHEMF
jgi:predicted acetyltransferase